MMDIHMPVLLQDETYQASPWTTRGRLVSAAARLRCCGLRLSSQWRRGAL